MEATTHERCALCRSRKNRWAFRGGCRSGREEDSECKKFEHRIMLANKTLKNPYCFAEVSRLGEYGPERDEFGLRRGSLGQLPINSLHRECKTLGNKKVPPNSQQGFFLNLGW